MNPFKEWQYVNDQLRSLNGGKGTWFTRTFDPKGQEMYYNSAEAQKTRDFQMAEAEKSREFNSAEAQLNRDFQLEMSNTAYQRGVEDMAKAGLNPYLAYSSGGASVPSGSQASFSGSPAGASASVSMGSNAQVLKGMINLVGSALSLVGKVVPRPTTSFGFGK